MFVVSLFTSFLYLIRHYGIDLRFTLHSWTSSNNVEVFIATPDDPNEVKNETAPWTQTRGNVKFFFRPADEWGNPDVLYMHM